MNNVETLANVPPIVAEGADWLRANGTDASPGTMLFTICGDVRREGVFELPLGTPMRYLVEELGGGSRDGLAIKAVVPAEGEAGGGGFDRRWIGASDTIHGTTRSLPSWMRVAPTLRAGSSRV